MATLLNCLQQNLAIWSHWVSVTEKHLGHQLLHLLKTNLSARVCKRKNIINKKLFCQMVWKQFKLDRLIFDPFSGWIPKFAICQPFFLDDYRSKVKRPGEGAWRFEVQSGLSWQTFFTSLIVYRRNSIPLCHKSFLSSVLSLILSSQTLFLKSSIEAFSSLILKKL